MSDDPPASLEPGAPGPVPEPPAPPRPAVWGPWASLGLTLAVTAVYAVGQLMVASVLVAVETAWAGAGGARFAPGGLAANPGLLTVVAVCAAAPVATALVLLLAALRGPVVRYLALVWPRWKPALLWAAAVAGFLWAYDVVGARLGRPPVPDFMLEIYKTAGPMPPLWLALVVMAPLIEETLFRGFLIRGLAASRLEATGAVALSALLWAGIHLQYDLYDMTGIFLLGLLFGAMRLATGSTLLPMAIHAGVNAFAILQVGWLVGNGMGS
jgi:hypothetical protein